MNKDEFVKTLETTAIQYIQGGVYASIYRNGHLTGMSIDKCANPRELVEMAVIDFINYAAAFQGLDLGLKRSDLGKNIKKEKVKDIPDNIINPL